MACFYNYKGERFSNINDLKDFVSKELEGATSAISGGLYSFNNISNITEESVEQQRFGDNIIAETKNYTLTPTSIIDSNGRELTSYNESLVRNTFLLDGDYTDFRVAKD